MKRPMMKLFFQAVRPAMLALSAACSLLPATAWADNKALALGWKGYADTDLDFSEFFNGEHTVSYHFMAQYPSGAEGPVLAQSGAGTYFIGQAHFWVNTPPKTRIMLAIGSQSAVFDVDIHPGEWHHLAVTTQLLANGKAKAFYPYLDGVKLGLPVVLTASDAAAPSGKLRLGKMAAGQTLADLLEPQFYGLIDDVAIFNRRLTDEEVANLAKDVQQLTGNESGLIAGYTFDGGSQPAKLSRPVTLHNWAAKRVGINRTSGDLAAIPLPFTQAEMTLPFKEGEAWYVIQGFDSGLSTDSNGVVSLGSHNGMASFCWDFKLNGYDQTVVYPYGTRFAPFYAVARGKVAFLQDGALPNQDPANIVNVLHGTEEYGEYLHFWSGTAQVALGSAVERTDTLLALAGNTGTKKDHLHYATTKFHAYYPGQMTIPSAFSNYELKNEAGVFHRVLRGIPEAGQVIRTPVDPGNRYAAIWRDDNTDAIHDEHMEFTSFADYKAAYDKIFPQGWRLRNLVANVVDGVVYYSATWYPDNASETQVYGKTFAEYKAKRDLLVPDGWKLHILQAYVVGGQVLYNAVWRKEAPDELPLYAQSYASYRWVYDSLWPTGWRLHILQAYVLNGQVLYNAVFRQVGGGSETQSYGVNWDGLHDRNETLKAQGWRLSIINSYVVNGKLYFNAVWKPGSAPDKSVYDASYAEFKSEYDLRRSMGWRLEWLDVHHY